jgi:4-amino-4-deoxy-L-arabinose transferase-like glycosyltransferase
VELVTIWLRKNRDKALLLLILLLTVFLTGYKIWELGDGNAYYTATVKSMLTSWHNFFYASFDPGGFITVDKPALGFWLQCLFGLVFGVSGWSLALPEILCSVVSVAVLYHIVKRSFGTGAGLLAALLLALTPVFIAATRTNNLDASLVLVCLLAVWAAVAAAEKGSLRHLLLAAGLLGLGFNIKMLQAYLYLPALFLVYFFTANAKLKKRIAHLAIAAVVLLVVSLSWCVVVELTPPNSRPYVGSSETNSMLELAFGYNGIARVVSAETGYSGGAMTQMAASDMIPNEGGPAGVLRLLNNQMAGQAGWLLALAVFGLLALLIRLLSRQESDKKAVLRQFLLWLGLFAPMVAYFSITGHFHRYYLIMLAPCLAALGAIAVTELLRLFLRKEEAGSRLQALGRAGLLPLAIAVTAGVQIYILTDHYTAYADIFVPVIAVGAGLSAAGLVLIKILKTERKAVVTAAVAVGLAGLLAAPAYWAYTPIMNGSTAALPIAGPPGTTGGMSVDGWTSWGSTGGTQATQGAFTPKDGARPENPAGGPPNNGQVRTGGFGELPTELAAYMLAHNDGARWLVAVPNAIAAEPLILEHGVGVMALGGFIGMDNAVSLEAFKALVARGELQYYWAGGYFFSEISKWVAAYGVRIDASEWGGEVFTGVLYDLSGLRAD